MGLFGRRQGNGLMDQIRCDETSYLIWKWRPQGGGANQRQNAIRWGSALQVRQGSVAVFVNSLDPQQVDFIGGPYDAFLETANLPLLAPIMSRLYGGGTPFQAEVYFINLAHVVQVKFGVPFFDVFDPAFPEFGVPVAVRGTVTFHIEDYREFVRLHGMRELDLENFRLQIRSAVTQQVKSAVSGIPGTHAIPVVQLESRILDVSDLAGQRVGERLACDFGVSMSALDIEAIEVDKRSDDCRRLMEVTRDITSAATQARARVEIRDMEDQQRIHAHDLEESLRIRREEGQYAQRMQTRQAYLDTILATGKVDVALAGAEALESLGSSGGDAVSGAMSPAGMMASMAMGTWHEASPPRWMVSWEGLALF